VFFIRKSLLLINESNILVTNETGYDSNTDGWIIERFKKRNELPFIQSVF